MVLVDVQNKKMVLFENDIEKSLLEHLRTNLASSTQ